MKRILELALIALLLSAGVVAAGETPHYSQAAKFTLGGGGGWDYLTYDPAGDRLFIAHNKAVLVVAAADGKRLGEIPADGAHGIALVPEKNRGFITNGRAGTVTVFDLSTLKATGEIKAGDNPDAIIYDPYSKRVLVMNGRSKDLMAIDPDSLKVVATVPLGGKLEFAPRKRATSTSTSKTPARSLPSTPNPGSWSSAGSSKAARSPAAWLSTPTATISSPSAVIARCSLWTRAAARRWTRFPPARAPMPPCSTPSRS